MATAYGDQGYFRSGFNARLRRGVLTRGPHELEIRIVLSDEGQYYSAVRLRFEAL